MISIQHLRKRFKKLPALNDISAELRSGQVIALIGPNGSGKTTLIKCILGLVRPGSGTIYVNDIPVNEGVQYRKDIGYMPQIGRYPDNLTAGQLFSMIRNIRQDTTKIDEELYYKFKLDTISDKSMKTLSGGTRQKVSAGLAFLFDPPILILDEPTAGLDPVSSEVLKSKILAEKEKGKLIIITSHILSDLDEITTDIMYLQDGKLAFYKPLHELQLETGEQKLGKAIACMIKKEKPELKYLKIAR
jgi:Cu-processing system ATP-binding protein